MDAQVRMWLKLAQAGDTEAAAELIGAFYERLYAFLRRLAGNDTEAADLTQRTFARVWKSLPSFAGRSSVSSWMHSIAYRTYVDWLRGNHRTEERSEAWWQACADPGVSPAEAAMANDLAVRLYAAVEELEPDVRATVHLRHYQGLSLEETAEALGVAESTVKYRLKQALPHLQRRLASEPSLITQPLNRTRS
jgi:RNA polymerase sigma-70 factor (ECF subfamily)